MQLPNEFVQPAYNGRSIANIPATVAKITGSSFTGLESLEDNLWQNAAPSSNRVVVLLLDAMGWNLIQKWRAELSFLLDRATLIEKITSVCPSTTTVALTSFWTGNGPAGHGLAGLTQFLGDYAVGTQMISFTPTFDRYPDALINAGLDLTQFLDVPGMAEQLTEAGIPTFAYKGREIVDSALSKMHGRGVAGNVGAITFADMLVQMRDCLHEHAGRPLYISGYWPTIDTISHFRNWSSEAVKAELTSLFHQIQTIFLDGLTDQAKANTSFFIVADHGQTSRNREQLIRLEDHPELMSHLLMRPMGDMRVAYLYAKQGKQDAIIEYVNNHLGDRVLALGKDEALATGIFGPAPYTQGVKDRIGDVVLLMRGQTLFYTDAQQYYIDNFLAGHGGLTSDEMEVPWIGFDLGAL